MLCTNPYMLGVMPCACGQCDPCRLKRKKLWANRIMLESFKHAYTSFVTLTYDEQNHPKDGSLNLKDYKNWLKRLRFALAPRTLRFYLAGEYGDETWRPHYHAVVFGLSVQDTDTVRTTWNMGHVVVDVLTPQRAAYVAGYVTKKMSRHADPRLQGKYPEFQRMSLRPGIGATAIEDVGTSLKTKVGQRLITELGDVPSTLRMASQTFTIGRYLRRKLRQNLGRSPDAPEEAVKKIALEMRVLLEDHVKTTGTPARGPKKLILDMNAQKVNNLIARTKIYRGNKTI